jgi:hypothetical protein
MKASISASLRADADVASSRAPWPASAGWARIVAHRLEAATRRSTSSRSARKFGSMRGGAPGSALASVTLPRLFGRSRQTWHE